MTFKSCDEEAALRGLPFDEAVVPRKKTINIVKTITYCLSGELNHYLTYNVQTLYIFVT